MTDPYKVLGVPRDASDADIKKAYRDLARKYHPDNYVNDPLADLAQEKMKEINEAYDAIQRDRAKGASGMHGRAYDYNDFGNRRSSGDFQRIRELIKSGRFSEADIFLDSVSVTDRNAEWYFLKGNVLLQRGWVFDAQKCFEHACYMDPNNAEYKMALDKLRDSAAQYAHGGRTYNRGCSPCDLCFGLACGDFLCECLGSDLISCC